MFTELILKELGVSRDTVAKKKHGQCPEIQYGYLIDTILRDNGKTAAYKLFPIGEQTFHRMMRKIFPDVKLNGGQQTWFFYLLSMIGYKNCGRCSTIKHLEEFHNDKNNSSLGKCSICKSCVAIEQEGQYSKYKEAHDRSNTKLKYVKLERNNRYKLDRSKRAPSWSETKEIEQFYSRCPEGKHVDHELPLKGEFVSGLHVLANLQYLTEKENLSKGNRIDLDEYNKKYYNS